MARLNLEHADGSDIDKAEKYIKRFFDEKRDRKENFNRCYSLRAGELISFMDGFLAADIDSSFQLVILLYEYGYARGYRSHAKEQKKREKERR